MYNRFTKYLIKRSKTNVITKTTAPSGAKNRWLRLEYTTKQDARATSALGLITMLVGCSDKPRNAL